MTWSPILPPATIGMLGGGQLGRYTLMAARRMGYRTIVLDPSSDAPAGAVADVHLVAGYDDHAALVHMGEQCDVVTTEFENPPAAGLALLAASTVVAPRPEAVGIAQHRVEEKTFLERAGIPVGPWRSIERAEDLHSAAQLSFPCVLKTARMGYDGKGQAVVPAHADLAPAWASLDEVPCVLEQRLALDREVSVLVARSANGDIATSAVTENAHVGGILDLSIAPAPVSAGLAERTCAIGVSIARELDYVGLLGVECFVVDGDVKVNEIAPRPHNSGHWTLDAARTDQFEQQVRAVCGLGLGDMSMTVPAVAMVNLLGDLWRERTPDWGAALEDSRVSLHLYGKAEPRPGRKMGHLTATGNDVNDSVRLVREAHTRLSGHSL